MPKGFPNVRIGLMVDIGGGAPSRGPRSITVRARPFTVASALICSDSRFSDPQDGNYTPDWGAVIDLVDRAWARIVAKVICTPDGENALKLVDQAQVGQALCEAGFSGNKPI